jgi:hypothetical protein
MVRSLILATFVVMMVGSARADLQLTPIVVEYNLDGVKLKELAFYDGEAKILYQPPRGWEYFGAANQLTLRPPKKSQAEATITKIALPESGGLDDENLKKLVSEALALLPKDSVNATVVSQEKNHLLINRKETFLLNLSYTLSGQPFYRSILFVNRGREQLRCQLTCREADFKELNKAFLSSQYSWQNL